MKRALVFCGGGAKGSYEQGVWKYLDEHNQKFDIVTGTSIGGLNAIMYAQNDYIKSMELWGKITLDMIMKDAFKYDENVSIKYSLKQKDNLIGFLGSYLKGFGGDISPFYDVVDEYVKPEKLINSPITCGIVTTKFPSFQGVEIVLNKETPENIKKYAVATASAFPIFQVCKIGKESFIDGGYYDNLPIDFAIELGAMDIVAIDLSPNVTHKEYLNKSFIKYIYPRWSLGGFLKFDRDMIMKNFELGYIDAKKAYGELIGFKYAFYKVEDDHMSRPFVLQIAKVVNYMTKNKIKSNVRPEIEGDLFHILETSTSRPLTDFEYYLRAIEIAGEAVSLDHYKVYKLEDFISLINEALNQVEYDTDLFMGYSRLKNINKKKDFVSRMSSMSLLKYALNNEFDMEGLAVLASSKPKVFIIYMILRS